MCRYTYICIYIFAFMYIPVTLILLIFVGNFDVEESNEISKDTCTVVWYDGLVEKTSTCCQD